MTRAATDEPSIMQLRIGFMPVAQHSCRLHPPVAVRLDHVSAEAHPAAVPAVPGWIRRAARRAGPVPAVPLPDGGQHRLYKVIASETPQAESPVGVRAARMPGATRRPFAAEAPDGPMTCTAEP